MSLCRGQWPGHSRSSLRPKFLCVHISSFRFFQRKGSSAIASVRLAPKETGCRKELCKLLTRTGQRVLTAGPACPEAPPEAWSPTHTEYSGSCCSHPLSSPHPSVTQLPLAQGCPRSWYDSSAHLMLTHGGTEEGFGGPRPGIQPSAADSFVSPLDPAHTLIRLKIIENT